MTRSLKAFLNRLNPLTHPSKHQGIYTKRYADGRQRRRR